LGTKENIEYIRQELTSEEKFLESLIKVEKFYKKYRKKLIGGALLLLIGTVGYIGYELKRDHDLRVSNQAYQQLLRGEGGPEALAILKEKNPPLYRLYLYQTSIEKGDLQGLKEVRDSDDRVLSDLAQYHIGLLERDDKELKSYGNRSDTLLREMALLDTAYLLYLKGSIGEGHSQLEKIGKESPAHPFSLLLRHYGVKQ